MGFYGTNVRAAILLYDFCNIGFNASAHAGRLKPETD
jgi:hypothetical protein